MNEKELDRQIAARKKEAEDKKFYGKAFAVARLLGTHIPIDHNKETGSKSYYPTHDYKGSGLTIATSSIFTDDGDGGGYASSMTISIHNDVVYKEGGGNITTYIPGDWESELEKLYSEALKKQEKINEETRAEELKKDQEKITSTQKKWGL